jgi:hypothetical protein
MFVRRHCTSLGHATGESLGQDGFGEVKAAHADLAEWVAQGRHEKKPPGPSHAEYHAAPPPTAAPAQESRVVPSMASVLARAAPGVSAMPAQRRPSGTA